MWSGTESSAVSVESRGAEAVLRGCQRVMIMRDVDVELLMDSALNHFLDHRDNKDGPEICGI